ncbi:MAG: PAS domain-containing protein [Candidatus Puniceispirillum sp.]|uniref:ATP-binding protein n=1 Tax=Candidatus Puniceispirillum sp. TaxID=2026719 RepID=UPI001ED60D44|nr:PAS domain-containing protein [Candidatus Puniceispirillum sp.]MBT6416295.1 PAS domain-containing protein [Candidatus Puniceispirillum sp.]MBT6566639.1 PAS domain-containing protein [Candidatus Puniceispirillum sp.]
MNLPDYASAPIVSQIAEMLDDGLIIADNKGTILSVNEAAVRFLGQNLIGQYIVDVVTHDDIGRVFALVAEGRIAQDMVYKPTDMVSTEFALRLKPLDDDMIALLFLDMTLQRNLENVRRDFVANVSHELRSPLTSLSGFIETMINGDVTDEAMQLRFLKIMDEESKRMTRLIDDLLSLSRVEVYEHIIPEDDVSVLAMISAVRDTLIGKAEARNMQIIVRDNRLDKTKPAQILGSYDELTEVFVNLVENAIKYGFEDSQIVIELTEPMPSQLQIDVINQGEGIAKQHLSRITERFYRIDKARSRQIGGTGLGLAIVKHILNRHRGHMRVESMPGASTVFKVTLPLLQSTGDSIK